MPLALKVTPPFSAVLLLVPLIFQLTVHDPTLLLSNPVRVTLLDEAKLWHPALPVLLFAEPFSTTSALIVVPRTLTEAVFVTLLQLHERASFPQQVK